MSVYSSHKHAHSHAVISSLFLLIKHSWMMITGYQSLHTVNNFSKKFSVCTWSAPRVPHVFTISEAFVTDVCIAHFLHTTYKAVN